jgi:high-affinity iron transporter
MWLWLSACSGDPRASSRAGEVSVPAATLASPEARARGRALFLQYCALCHGEAADGRGVRRAGLSSAPANFRNPEWRQAATPRQVFSTIRDGKPGTSMPAWASLDEAQSWDLTAYVLSVAESGP